MGIVRTPRMASLRKGWYRRMNETYQKAMDAIRDEMAKNPNSKEILGTGMAMTELLEKRPEIADKVLTKGKTLKGAFAALRDAAKKAHGGSGFCFMGETEGTEILAGYYGFEAGDTSSVTPEGVTPSPQGEGKGPVDDELSLDALLASGEAGLSPSAWAAPGETRDRATATGAGREPGGL